MFFILESGSGVGLLSKSSVTLCRGRGEVTTITTMCSEREASDHLAGFMRGGRRRGGESPTASTGKRKTT